MVSVELLYCILNHFTLTVGYFSKIEHVAERACNTLGHRFLGTVLEGQFEVVYVLCILISAENFQFLQLIKNLYITWACFLNAKSMFCAF